jgi:TetR/AcrR family transcriptional regulator
MVAKGIQTDVRARSLVAATRRFAERGFEATSLQQIADDVGVSKPAVLHHFASKDTLREAVLADIVAHWQRVLPRLLLAATASEGRFEAVFGELHRFFAADRERARLIARELFDRPAEVKRLLRGPVRPWLKAIAAYIEEGKARGRHYSDVDSEVYVLHIMQLVISATAAADILRAAIDTESDVMQRYDRELARIARASLFVTPLAGVAQAGAGTRVKARGQARAKRR